TSAPRSLKSTAADRPAIRGLAHKRESLPARFSRPCAGRDGLSVFSSAGIRAWRAQPLVEAAAYFLPSPSRSAELSEIIKLERVGEWTTSIFLRLHRAASSTCWALL